MKKLFDELLMYTDKAFEIENELDNVLTPIIEKYSKDVDIFQLRTLLEMSIGLIFAERMYEIQHKLLEENTK